MRRFLFAGGDPPVIERIASVKHDEELARRNAERIAKAKALLGPRWALHSANKVRRLDRGRAPDLTGFDPDNVVTITRRKHERTP